MKNPINVIDQELIGWFDEWFSHAEENEFLQIDEKTQQLLTMAKDLIEINAELTKENQVLKNFHDVFCKTYVGGEGNIKNE